MILGMEHLSYEGKLNSLGFFSLEKHLRVNMTKIYKIMHGIEKIKKYFSYFFTV